jgi:hypothetical protein
LTILARCKGGNALAHEWSQPYPRYVKRETEKKLAHALQAPGPATCGRIADETDRAWCDGCPARANGVRSPIALGMVATLDNGDELRRLPDGRRVLVVRESAGDRLRRRIAEASG